MGQLLKLKKKIIRAFQEQFGSTIEQAPPLPQGVKVTKRLLIAHYKGVKPSIKITYLKAFKLFVNEISFEYHFMGPEDR